MLSILVFDLLSWFLAVCLVNDELDVVEVLETKVCIQGIFSFVHDGWVFTLIQLRKLGHKFLFGDILGARDFLLVSEKNTPVKNVVKYIQILFYCNFFYQGLQKLKISGVFEVKSCDIVHVFLELRRTPAA